MPILPSPFETPAMSRWAQRWPSVKRDRKQPAVIAPAQLAADVVDVGEAGIELPW
jgi:hypothetical protein